MKHEHAALPAVAQLTAQAKRAGVDLPPALHKGITALKAEQTRAVAVLDDTPAALARIAAALLDERDPFSVDTVRADAAAIALAAARLQVGGAVEAAVDNRARALARKHLPGIVAALAAELTRRGEHIAAARKAVPKVDLTEPGRPQVAAQHLTTWALAREAVEAVPLIVGAWQSAHAAAYGTSAGHVDPALIVADVDTPTLDRLNRKGSSVAHVAAEGHALELADLAAYQARRDRADTDRANAARRAREQAEKNRNAAMSYGIV